MMPTLLDLMTDAAPRAGMTLRDVLQGASNAAASTVSAPVDLAAAGLRFAGVPVPENAFGSSAWARERGLTREPQSQVAGTLGELLGGVAPIAAASRGVQAAEALSRLRLAGSDGGMNFGQFERGVVKPEAVQQALERWKAAKAGEHVPSMLRRGLVLTDDQLEQINRAYARLTGGKQPPSTSREIDIAAGHIYDARMSGALKPSGRVADEFSPEEVARWLPVAGADDAAVALNSAGKPYLSNVYVDPKTGERINLEMPISADQATGRQWASGLVPRGKKAPRPR